MMRTACALLLVALCGCASPPNMHYWSLQRMSTTTPTSPGATCSVQVGPVGVPEVYDQTEIVVDNGAQKRWLDNERWDSPFPQAVADRLATSLGQSLGTRRVYAWPNSLSERPDFLVTLQILRMRSELGGAVRIEGLWTIKPAGQPGLQGDVNQEKPVSDGHYATLVSATGEVVDAIGQDLAHRISQLHGCGTLSGQ
ncbi:MAG: membrane integrity-associated transporter subunit PqiC [Burkholderiales bacterium]|nr:membrane integrity-associated transporter subunit PqiC [Burkholderiales bacterium]